MKSDQETERVYSYNPGGRMPGPQKNISKLEQHSVEHKPPPQQLITHNYYY